MQAIYSGIHIQYVVMGVPEYMQVHRIVKNGNIDWSVPI